MSKWKTNHHRAQQYVLGLAALLVACALALPGGASAAEAPSLFWKSCEENGSGAGQCLGPRGIAADPDTGNLYVVDANTNRVNEFTPWGGFVKAWGWGVADGASELQSCGPGATPPTATCQKGLPGSGPGQLANPRGVALDSNGDVYVIDPGNQRVQKFDPDGNFLLMFGGGVDKGGGTPSNPGNVCTAEYVANGDSCGAGSIGIANGEFSGWKAPEFPPEPGVSSEAPSDLITIDQGLSDTIYVGDQDRIQKFDANGTYTGQVALPEAGAVGALDFDPSSDDLYFSYQSPVLGFPDNVAAQPDVYRLDPASGKEIGSRLKVGIPLAIATDTGGNVYVSDLEGRGNSGTPLSHPPRIFKFDSAGTQVATLLFQADFTTTQNVAAGLATSSACGIPGVDVYVASEGFYNPTVAAYGPPPNPTICPPPSVAPSIEATYAVSVDTDGATVRASINPHFWPDTRYYVQYGVGKCSEGGCDKDVPIAPGSKLTAKVLNSPVNTAGIFLGGLQPGATYHYRFVAQSGGGGPVIGPERSLHTFPASIDQSTVCPNAVFRTGPSAKLPDCRAYEMVSPLEKNNGDVASQRFYHFVQASADGSRMTFSSFRSFGQAEAAPLVNQYLASRDPETGWSTRAINPPRGSIALYAPGVSESIQYKAFSKDLCSGWVVEDTGLALTPGAPPSVPNLYRRDLCGPQSYELLTSVAPPGFGYEAPESSFHPEIQGFSSDGSRSVFRADATLTSNANPKKSVFQVYVTSPEGKLRLVSVLPNGNAASTNASVGTPQSLAMAFRENSLYNAVSEDASRVYWSNSANGGLSFAKEQGRLYLRLNATEAQSKLSGGKCTEASKACTIVVSTDQATLFVGANPEGTRAIYEVVKKDAVAGELYEFNLATETSQLIAKGVKGEIGASEDTSRVYFASTEVLSGEQANSQGAKAQAGALNLYRYDADGGSLTFVATLSAQDARGPEILDSPSPLTKSPMRRMARISPNGDHVAFISYGSLTGYDNIDAKSGEPDSEVFLYDARANGGVGSLVCASCNPSGARPTGRFYTSDALIVSELWAASFIPGWQSQTHPTRALSDDGSRLFFNSFEALLPRDTNGHMDVYEWEAPGSGDCTEQRADYFASNGGCISLISSGESPEDSEFFDATPDGKDVYFATQSSLLPQDFGLADVYNAREGGGFPPPPALTPACEGEACQGPLAPPNDPTPASSAYQGPGNPKAPAAKKKKAKKKAKKGAHSKKSQKRANAKRRAGR